MEAATGLEASERATWAKTPQSADVPGYDDLGLKSPSGKLLFAIRSLEDIP